MNFPRRKAARRAKAEAMGADALKVPLKDKLAKARGKKERERLARRAKP